MPMHETSPETRWNNYYVGFSATRDVMNYIVDKIIMNYFFLISCIEFGLFWTQTRPFISSIN